MSMSKEDAFRRAEVALKKAQDKYGAQVMVYLVDVPLYNKDETRQKDAYMLTRALSKKDFANYQSTNNMRLTKVCFNGSKNAVYVMTDENGAIQTTHGYVGLFADKNHAVVVAAKHVGDFIAETFAEMRKDAEIDSVALPGHLLASNGLRRTVAKGSGRDQNSLGEHVAL